MLSRGTEQGSTKTMELRQHTGRNQLTTIGGGGRTLVDGTVNEPASVTVQVGSAAAAPARVTSQSPSGPYRFQREADFPVGSTNLTITAKDGNNNTRTQTYTVSVTDAETRSLGYDSNGNLKTKTYLRRGTAYRVETYTWDAENRLTGWQDKTLATPTAPEIIAASTTWSYDGLGRRVKEHNVQGTTVTDKTILWSGLEMIQWQNPDGTVARNLFATGEQKPSSSLQPQASSLIYLPDHLGSVRAWYNPADNTKGSADFSTYGTRTITANTATFTPTRSFTGHYQHEASGLVLAPYRAYDAELGRWLNEDPLEQITGESPESLPEGPNLYSYVGNGPLDREDPLGLHLYPVSHYKPMNPSNPYPGLLGPKEIAGCYAKSHFGVLAVVAPELALSATAETAAGATGGSWITNNVFRWGTAARYKQRGKWVEKGLHCHVGPGEELMGHHLPYQIRGWMNHAWAKLRGWWNSL